MLFGAAVITTLVLLIGESVFHLKANQILFSGNSGMPELIAQTSVTAVIFILIGKSIAFAAALGGGFRGGPIFPATFLGVAVGVLGSLILPDANVSALAAAGIAASAAAFTKLPATSALLGALLIAGTGAAIAPFAIFGAVIGLLVRLLVDRRIERTVIRLDA
jgi:H+/Cl- antiporter ClcA